MAAVKNARRAVCRGLRVRRPCRRHGVDRASAEIGQKRADQLPVDGQFIRQQEGVVAATALDVAVADRLTGGNQRVDDLLRLERREQPVARETHQQPAAAGGADRRGEFFRGIPQIEQVHRHRKRQVAVGVETLAEAVSLVRQIRADGELGLEFGPDEPRLESLGVEFLHHAFAGEVGDMSQHSRNRQAHQRRPAGPVILPCLKIRIAEDRVAADDVEGQRLARQTGRGGDRNGAGQPVGVARRPVEDHVAAERAADHRQ